MEDISYDWVILPELTTISSGSGKIIVQDQSTNNTAGLASGHTSYNISNR